MFDDHSFISNSHEMLFLFLFNIKREQRELLHFAVSIGISQEKSLALICARSRSRYLIYLCAGDRFDFRWISTSDTRYNATRVPVHEHRRARPRDYIGVRTVGRWDERERIVVRTRRLPSELIGCSSERARRARERERWSAERAERVRTQKRHGISARETASEAVERRDRIKRGRWETSPGSPAEDKARREEKGSTRGWDRRERGEEARERARGKYTRVYIYMRVYAR